MCHMRNEHPLRSKLDLALALPGHYQHLLKPVIQLPIMSNRILKQRGHINAIALGTIPTLLKKHDIRPSELSNPVHSLSASAVSTAPYTPKKVKMHISVCNCMIVYARESNLRIKKSDSSLLFIISLFITSSIHCKWQTMFTPHIV